MKKCFRLAAVLAAFGIALALPSCSNGADDNSALLAALLAAQGSNKNQQAASNTYTVTFNANDGSQTPATATQSFAAGTPQKLKTIAELGFKKGGFYFIGWGESSAANQAAYQDGASYTASANATLYALWSDVPHYNIKITASSNGSVTASQLTAAAGTEIALTATAYSWHVLGSYDVKDAGEKPVAVNGGKFIMPESDVTVTAAFTSLGGPDGAYKSIDTKTINGIDYDIVTFGVWPQTKVIGGVNVDASAKTVVGGSAYCRGSDNEWYANVGDDWFKVEPIKWRVLTNNYGGNKLLLAENILAGSLFFNNWTETRTINGKTVYPNNYEHSIVRAFLNGISYNNGGSQGDEYNGKGFLQTAFTEAEQETILTTNVDNSRRASAPDNNAERMMSGADYISEDTSDKIFLLSERELTKAAYGFAADDKQLDDERIRQTTDYARADGAFQSSTAGKGGWWWQRALSSSVKGATGGIFYLTIPISCEGRAYLDFSIMNSVASLQYKGGVVPALCVAGGGEQLSYSVTVQAVDTITGCKSLSVNKAASVAGQTITLSCEAETNFAFDAWIVKDANGNSVTVTGNSFTMPASDVTVSARFTELITFGYWPQTIKASNVDVSDQCEYRTIGEFTYYRGSDDEWYAKIKETASLSGFFYSDGSPVALSSANSERWFKVEPIKWRVLTTDYNGTGKKLLLAENILIGKRYDASSKIYQTSEIRKWLNSNANSDAESDYGDSVGFLKTAFTAAEQTKIVNTSVDNSARSTNPDNNATQWINGNNPYASDTPTIDKVFLLSEQEVTTSAYGFDTYNVCGVGNKRIRVTTDFAKASGAQQSATEGMGGGWWLRSPYFRSNDDNIIVRIVRTDGGAGDGFGANTKACGVVPAICLDN